MYVKRYVLTRGDKRYSYLRLVASYRTEEGKVRHRVLQTLGREDELKASGALDQLAASFARLDPPRLGIRREVGPLLVVRHVIERCGIGEIIDDAAGRRRRSALSVGEVIVALIANRLAAPAPLYDVAGWGSGAALQELFGIPAMLLNDDRLGRALEEFHPVAEAVRGAVTLAAIDRFGVEAGRLHLDLTGLRFEGAYESSALVAKGWQAGGKVIRQVKALAATNPQGVALYVRPHAGDQAELLCVGAALEALAKLCPPGLIVCADSAFGHPKNLCEAQAAGVRFVVPLRRDCGFAQTFLSEVGHEALRPIRYVSRRQRRLPPDRRARYRGVLRPFPVTDPTTGRTHPFRVAYIHSSEEEKSVAEGRERALAKAEEALGRVSRGLGGRYYKTRKQVDDKVARILIPSVMNLLKVRTGTRKGKPTLFFERDATAIAEAAKTDGIYALATNLHGAALSAGQLLRIYKDQSLVECAHRNAKGPLKVRPVFLHNDTRIEALVSVVGLALVVFGLIEAEVRKALGDQELLPAFSPRDAPAGPPAATSSPVSRASGSPTPQTASCWTASPPRSGGSFSSLASPSPGPSSSPHVLLVGGGE